MPSAVPLDPLHPWCVLVAGEETEYPQDLSEELGPVDPPKQKDLVSGGEERGPGYVKLSSADDTSPINDNGKNAPVSKNPAPPAAPFPAKAPPSSSMPPSAAPEAKDTPLKPDPEDDDGPGTNDDSYEGYVGGHLGARMDDPPSVGHIEMEWVEAATAQCPICGEPPVSSCRCIGSHTMEMLAAGHGKTCANNHRWSGKLAYCMATAAVISPGCPVCGGMPVSSCRCSGPHSLEAFEAGHGSKCAKGHRWSGSFVCASVSVAEPRLDPKPLRNQDGGGLAPNPDNATDIPTVTPKDTPDSGDDDGAKPKLDELSWFMGKHEGSLTVDSHTGIAKWPRTFDEIEKGFKRPNKVPDPGMEPNDPHGQDSEYIGETDKPFETGSPPI